MRVALGEYAFARDVKVALSDDPRLAQLPSYLGHRCTPQVEAADGEHPPFYFQGRSQTSFHVSGG